MGQGTGLGLSLCYGIVQEHEGTIVARSEPGRGATFVIELPVAKTGDHGVLRHSPTKDPFAEAPPTVTGSILVIDDEPWILDLASELLRADGHTVATALGGERALDLLREQEFALIVSDWKMPGLNGVRLYEHLCETKPAAAKFMIFMTGDVVSDDFQNFLRKNSLTCLAKPFAIGEFRSAVAKTLQAAVAARGRG